MNPLRNFRAREIGIEICFTGTATGEDLLDISRTNGVMNLSSAMTLRNVHEKLNSSKKSRLTQANPETFHFFESCFFANISWLRHKRSLQRGILQFILHIKLIGMIYREFEITAT